MSTTETMSKWSEPQKLDYSQFNHKPEEIAPRDEMTEEQLFAGNHAPAGEALQNLEMNVTVEGPHTVDPCKTFDEMAIHEVVRENVKRCGYTRPTAIQGYCVPALLKEIDIVAVAQTGSGKTAAYMIPIVSKLIGKLGKIGGPRVDTSSDTYNPERDRVIAQPLVLIVCPTRELAQQIFDETRRIAYRSKLLPVCAYGGMAMKYNVQQLGKGCDILIGTPGRICDLMDKPHIVSMARLKYTVIDEADEMLQDDWSDELEKIMIGGDTNQDADHRYLMFSATFPKGARALARQYMTEEYIRIRVGRAGSSHKNIHQVVVWVDEDAKRQALLDLLTNMTPGRVVIFCNNTRKVDELDDFLYNKGNLPTTFIHGGRNQFERDDAMRSFRLAETPIMITTSVTARGIDFPDVKQVINYDMPSAAYGGIGEYVHRIGRTARMGHTGTATSFYNDRDSELGQDLVNLLLETGQEVPDFLESMKPEDGKVTFDDDSSDGEGEGEATEEPAAAEPADDAWGGDSKAEAVDNTWGAPGANKVEDSGWGTEQTGGGAEANSDW